MPNLEVHVFYSKMLHPDIDEKIIREVSRKMDSTAKTKGPSHREDYHSRDPFKEDSVEVHNGDFIRYQLQQEHIMLDSNPALASAVEQMYVNEKYKKKADSAYYRKLKL